MTKRKNKISTGPSSSSLSYKYSYETVVNACHSSRWYILNIVNFLFQWSTQIFQKGINVCYTNKYRCSYPYTGLDRPWELQEVEVQRISRLSAHDGGKIVNPTYRPQEISLVLVSVRGWVEPRTIVWPERLNQQKIPMTSAGIEPAIRSASINCATAHSLYRYICILTYLLTPWSRLLLEKLTSKLCS